MKTKKILFLFLSFSLLFFQYCAESQNLTKNKKDSHTLLKTEPVVEAGISQILASGGEQASRSIYQHMVKIIHTLEITVNSGRHSSVSDDGPACTGNFVQFQNDPERKTHILTAAHCFDQYNNRPLFGEKTVREQGSSYQALERRVAYAYFPDEKGNIQKNLRCPILKYVNEPNFKSLTTNHQEQLYDSTVAIIDFNCQVPSWIKPLPIAKSLSNKHPFFLGGYGILKTGTRSVNQVYYYTLPGNEIQTYEHADHAIASVYLKNKRLCGGDSGGPLLMQTPQGFATIGTLVGAYGRVNEPQPTGCEILTEIRSVYSRIDTKLNWIRSALQEEPALIEPESGSSSARSSTQTPSLNQKSCLNVFSLREDQKIPIFQDPEKNQPNGFLDTEKEPKITQILLLSFKGKGQNGKIPMSFLYDGTKIGAFRSGFWINGENLHYYQTICSEQNIATPWAH